MRAGLVWMNLRGRVDAEPHCFSMGGAARLAWEGPEKVTWEGQSGQQKEMGK